MQTIIRSGALAALVTLCPAALVGLVASPASAQQDKITEVARAKFTEGVEAYGKGRYVEARDLFLQAYAMKHHPAVLLNLGLSELKLGETAEGANHLQQFLREFDKATPSQKSDARTGIETSKKTSGYAIVIVDADGAQLTLDGQHLGQSPLVDPVFVKPGDHDIEARANGRVARTRFQAKAGAMASVQLNVRSGAVETAPVEPRPVQSPPDTGGEKPPSKVPEPEVPPKETNGGDIPDHDLPPAENGPYMGPGFGSSTPLTTSEPPSNSPGSARPGVFAWLKQKPAAIATLSVGGGLGLIGTLGFGIGAGVAKGSAGDVSTQILTEVQSPSSPSGQLPAGYYDAGGKPIPCGSADDPSTAHPYYRDACDLLRQNLDAYDVDIALMATSLVVMTLSVGGTALWYYLDTEPKSGAAPTSGAFVTVAPILTGDQRGLGFVGTF